jgi:hypothetical protein
MSTTPTCDAGRHLEVVPRPHRPALTCKMDRLPPRHVAASNQEALSREESHGFVHRHTASKAPVQPERPVNPRTSGWCSGLSPLLASSVCL